MCVRTFGLDSSIWSPCSGEIRIVGDALPVVHASIRVVEERQSQRQVRRLTFELYRWMPTAGQNVPVAWSRLIRAACASPLLSCWNMRPVGR